MTNDSAVHPDLEGFLDDTFFNGVIFLLREPNTGKENKQTEFWLKKRLTGNYAYNDAAMDKAQIRNDKRAYTKYRNRFHAMLTYVYTGSDKELRHAAYFNLRPDAGEISRSKEYSERAKDSDYVTKKFKSIVDYCKSRTYGGLTVFTCSDIFEILAECYLLKSIERDGVDYGKRGKMRLFKFQWNEPDHCGTPITITVYEIIHPSRSPKLIFEK